MANVTYLIGAGASAGKRGDNGYIIEGLPCVNEISNSLLKICTLVDKTSIPNDLEWKEAQVGLSSVADWECARINLWHDLQRLYIQCERHATIDTYAKKLVLRKWQPEFKRLEQLLTLFFIYLQMQNHPDSRYDTFYANIIEPNLHFPPNIRVISWNYDSQFELAYSSYDDKGGLLVGYKNATFDMDYEIIKINGTAAFGNQTSIVTLRKDIWEKIWAIKEKPYRSEQLQREQTWLLEFIYLYQLYVVGKTDNTHLSFAFDRSQPSEKIFNRVDKIIGQTDALVIIGYTFPFFNREIDRKILKYLKPTAKIYIQDPNPKSVRQSLEAVLTKEQSRVQIVEIDHTEQFYLPPEL